MESGGILRRRRWLPMNLCDSFTWPIGLLVMDNAKRPPQRSFWRAASATLRLPAARPASHVKHQPLHEPGRYLVGSGLSVDGPHFQAAIVLPPSVVGASAVVAAAFMYGVKVIEFAVAEVVPPRLVSLAT